MGTRHEWSEDIEQRQLESGKLKDNENLRFFAMFKLNVGKDLNIDNLFHVITKDNTKAEFRIITKHNASGHNCEGHTMVVAEYPIEDLSELIEEVKDFTKYSIKRILDLEKAGAPMKVNGADALILAEPPAGLSNEKVMQELEQASKERGFVTHAPLIRSMLGIGETSEVIAPVLESIAIKMEEQKANPSNTLAVAAQEEELITRYGKKRIAALAKKIGYKGVIVNKQNGKKADNVNG